jgi:hypothetical protein
MAPERQRVYDLFVLNVALQLFDAVATYQGVRFGWREGNPILATAFGLLGVGPALLLFKADACGLLFLLNRNRRHQLASSALGLIAAVYSVFSLGPWLTKFLILFARTL